jgi:hypothetical protein
MQGKQLFQFCQFELGGCSITDPGLQGHRTVLDASGQDATELPGPPFAAQAHARSTLLKLDEHNQVLVT